MRQGFWRRMTALTGMLALAACIPAPASRPAPKPAPEPPQSAPTAEALGPVRPVEMATCAQPPSNGQILAGSVEADGGNFYHVTNQTNALAIVKVRWGPGGPLVAAVFVAPGQSATVGPLLDGVYRTSFAMGRDFGPDCRRLDYPSGYGQAERSQTFRSRVVNDEAVGHTETYVLGESDIDGGEGPQALSAERFDAP